MYNTNIKYDIHPSDHELLSDGRQPSAIGHNRQIQTHGVFLVNPCRGVDASAFFGHEFVL